MILQYINLLEKGVLRENNEEFPILRYKGKGIIDWILLAKICAPNDRKKFIYSFILLN